METVKEKDAQTENLIKFLHERFEKFENKFENKLDKLDDKLGNITKELNDVKVTLERHGGNFNNINGRLERLENNTPTKDKVDNIEEKLTKIDTKVGYLVPSLIITLLGTTLSVLGIAFRTLFQ
ncbi:hypothetical protein [Spirulina sp. 06S082]|uniref:hypothetical protein n=1 Tax=Spirulina sp. 06S082 TaxID=3110248 RepID=UPI002B216752|nr:hypothetical protein [Spirulina sp. 06S082]MEA5470659.1 hypothetical protein [Spirulina sp. 06S082]